MSRVRDARWKALRQWAKGPGKATIFDRCFKVIPRTMLSQFPSYWRFTEAPPGVLARRRWNNDGDALVKRPPSSTLRNGNATCIRRRTAPAPEELQVLHEARSGARHRDGALDVITARRQHPREHARGAKPLLHPCGTRGHRLDQASSVSEHDSIEGLCLGSSRQPGDLDEGQVQPLGKRQAPGKPHHSYGHRC